MNDQTHNKEREHFFGAAKRVAMITMLSRVLGLVRDMMLIPLGAPRVADMFWTAFQIPHLFRRLFGEGALAAAFVPVFTDVSETSGWDRGRAVLANVAGLLAIILAALVLLTTGGLWATWVIWGGDGERAFLLQATALMLPYTFMVCMLAMGSAALQCKGRFTYPALTPAILNVAMISGAALARAFIADEQDAEKFFVIGASLLVGGLVQLIGIIWLLKSVRLLAWPRIRPVLEETKRIALLMGPMMIPLSVLQVAAFADKLIALGFTASEAHPNFPLQPGVVRCLQVATRLHHLPMGVLAISLATAVFPLLSRYAARNDSLALRQTVNRSLRLGAFMGIPSGVALILLAKPIIRMFFERGDFGAFDTERAAFMLQMYSLGMFAYFWNHVLLRAFFAQKDTRTPLILACVLSGLNICIVFAAVFTPLKGAAMGVATATTQTINAGILMWVLHKRLGKIGLGSIAGSMARTLLATAAMVGAIVAVLIYVSPPAGAGESVRAMLSIGLSILAGVAAFFLTARLLRCAELGELLSPRRTQDDN